MLTCLAKEVVEEEQNYRHDLVTEEEGAGELVFLHGLVGVGVGVGVEVEVAHLHSGQREVGPGVEGSNQVLVQEQ